MYKQQTAFTCSLTSMTYYLGMLIIVAGGASCDKFRAASCNSMFPLFSFIRGTNDVHGDPLALHNTWKEGSIPFWCFSGTCREDKITEFFF